jgi:hypothetical protein
MIDTHLPNNYWKLDAYTNGYQIVVIGNPPQETDEEAALHNCDQMGCGSLEHVIASIPILQPTPELFWAMTPSED